MNAEQQAPAPVVKKFWPRELVLGLLPLLLGFQILVWTAYLPIGLRGVSVFRTLYTSGYMLRAHEAGAIHDQERQLQIADTLVPLPQRLNQGMDHPAYEALFFAPLSLVPYKTALTMFVVVNVILLLITARNLSGSLWALSNRWAPLPVLLFLSFFPVTYAITGGNDSIMLLALFAGAFVAVESTNDFLAGFFVGLGLFKFQIAIPIALIYLIWKRWRFVLGFTASAGPAALISVLLVGTHGLRQYIEMLLRMSINLKTAADAEQFALSPRTMLNIRGLVSAALDGHLGHWPVQLLVFGCSLLVLAVVSRMRPSMSVAILAASLVSYHLNAPDAAVLLIPIGVALCGESSIAGALAVAALIVPAAAIFPLYGFLGCLPVLFLFCVYVLQGSPASPTRTVLRLANS